MPARLLAYLFPMTLFLSAALYGQAAWQPVDGAMLTRWGKTVSPENAWRDYPRPQLTRPDWENLNGLWDYALTGRQAGPPGSFDGQLLVPFCIESALSGVGKRVGPDERLWYRRKFAVPQSWKGRQVLLHFGAVDWEAEVWLNGKKLGVHRGGSDPFSFDITSFLKGREQELTVAVWDPTDAESQARGKQVADPSGIWYTPVTGIWQTVWLEPVAKKHIAGLLPHTDPATGRVTFQVATQGTSGREQLALSVSLNGQTVAEAVFPLSEKAVLNIPDPALWSPDSPIRYHVEAKLLENGKTLDHAKSYFAMRSLGMAPDKHGFQRLLLNGKPLFQLGTLDQGWWPDGLLTPPSSEGMAYDMVMLKEMGFNMLRKHIKAEPALFYYQADSLGLLVWQDMPSGFATANAPEEKLKAGAAKDWTPPTATAKQFEAEWKAIMDHLRFFSCIAVWVPFNEGWGQYDTERIANWTMQYDSTRLVNAVSGWEDRGCGHFFDAHQYPGPAMQPPAKHPGRAIVLGEFGGLGLPVEGHLWNPGMRNWGYRTYHGKDVLLSEYIKLFHNLAPMPAAGLAAAVYTQTSDVEGEVNGLLTYDREVVKMDPLALRALHAPLFAGPKNKMRPLALDSQLSPQPAMLFANLAAAAGPAAGTAANGPMTAPENGELWASKTFVLDSLPECVQLTVLGNAGIEVYLNGRLALATKASTWLHYDEVNLSSFKGLLQTGKNTLTIGFKGLKPGEKADFGLYGY